MQCILNKTNKYKFKISKTKDMSLDCMWNWQVYYSDRPNGRYRTVGQCGQPRLFVKKNKFAIAKSDGIGPLGTTKQKQERNQGP